MTLAFQVCSFQDAQQHSSMIENNENNVCAICREDFVPASSASESPPLPLIAFHEYSPKGQLPKGQHHFHYKCVSDWWEEQKNCPLCKFSISNLNEVIEGAITLEAPTGQKNLRLFQYRASKCLKKIQKVANSYSKFALKILVAAGFAFVVGATCNYYIQNSFVAPSHDNWFGNFTQKCDTTYPPLQCFPGYNRDRILHLTLKIEKLVPFVLSQQPMCGLVEEMNTCTAMDAIEVVRELAYNMTGFVDHIYRVFNNTIYNYSSKYDDVYSAYKFINQRFMS